MPIHHRTPPFHSSCFSSSDPTQTALAVIRALVNPDWTTQCRQHGGRKTDDGSKPSAQCRYKMQVRRSSGAPDERVPQARFAHTVLASDRRCDCCFSCAHPPSERYDWLLPQPLTIPPFDYAATASSRPQFSRGPDDHHSFHCHLYHPALRSLGSTSIPPCRSNDLQTKNLPDESIIASVVKSCLPSARVRRDLMQEPTCCPHRTTLLRSCEAP